MSKEFTKSEKILKISKKANRAISCQPRRAGIKRHDALIYHLCYFTNFEIKAMNY
jgi:hypothetical protein